MTKVRRAPAKRKTGKAARTGRSRDQALAKEAAEHFVRGVLTRGEAVPAGQELPPGATHEIVPGKGIRRKRFSLA